MLSPLNYPKFSALVFKLQASMDLRLLPIVTFLSLALAVTGATLSSEDYWQSVLINTRISKSFQHLLSSDVTEEKNNSVGVPKGGVNVNTGKGNSGSPTAVNVGRKGVCVSTDKSDGRTNVGVRKGGVSIHTGPKKKPVVVNVKPGPIPFNFVYGAFEDQLRDDPNVALFFQEKDLHQGTTMNLHFTKTTSGATFLSRKEAETIPFFSNKFSDVLQQLSVEPGSEEAQVMKNTIQECEQQGIEEEDKYCATSLESMVEFSTSKLGTNVQVILTEVEKKETQKQQYTITAGIQKMASDKADVCHDQPYVYAVFYCHSTLSTRVYEVPLVSADGTKVNAIAVCHNDTSK